jgi:hypothetical protein
MKKTILAGVGLLAVAAFSSSPIAAQSTTAWLHVRVEEARDSSKVSVNVPLSVVEAVIKASPDLIEKHGHIHLGDEHGLKLADLRTAWKELKAVGDAELVSVESDRENVKVQRKGDIVLVYVDQKGSWKEDKDAEKDAAKAEKEGVKAEKDAVKDKHKHMEQVRIEVPTSLVDALLSGEGDEANVQAAILELRKRRGDIVRVQDDDSHVRVWIDEQNTQAPAAPGK